MGRILTLAAKDVRRRLARPSLLLLNLAIPLVLAGLLSLVFGGGGDTPDIKMRLVVVDEDEGPVSMFLTGSSQNPMASENLEVINASNREEGMEKLRGEDATALLVIPEGFSDALLAGEKVELVLFKNPAQSVMPVIAEQGAEVVALYLSAARKALGDEAQVLVKLFEGEGWDDATGLATMIAVMYGRVTSAGEILFPPIIEISEGETDAEEETSDGFNLMGWIFPGMIIMGLLFSSTTQMRDLLEEARLGTLKRILSAPVGTSQVLIAKILSVAIIVGLAHIIFLLTGYFVFGISWGPLFPLFMVSLVLVLAVTGFAAMVYALATTQQQGDTFGGIIVMVMSLLGGAFFPIEAFPGWMKSVAMFTLNYWANDSLRLLTIGSGLDEIGFSVMALAGVGLSLMVVGMLLMKRRHLQGAF